MGRPTKPIDWQEFEKLCNFQCTVEEICHWFRISHQTLYRQVKAHYGESYGQVYEKKKGEGLISLRRAQFQLAQRNAAMAIFLGKNYLGQVDKQEHTGEGGGAIKHEVIIRGVAGETKKQLEEVLNGEGT